MQFIEVTTHTTEECADLVSDLFWGYANYGVAISDPADLIMLKKEKNPKWDYIDDALFDGPEEVLVKCFLPKDTAGETIPKLLSDLEDLRARTEGNLSCGSLETTQKEVDGDAWREIWKSHYRPIPMGKIVVCPEWIDYAAKEDEHVVKIDSNMAFGTGEHETTAMCIDLLQKYIRPGDDAVDVGTGSGILGISMALLGAKRVTMSDIDYVAVTSAKRNVKNNGVEKICTVFQGSIQDEEDKKGDVVTANITADVLIGLSDGLISHVKQGGILILSGIIHKRKQDVLSCFTAKGMEKIDAETRGEWNAFALRKKS